MSQPYTTTQPSLLPDDFTKKWLVLGLVLLIALGIRLYRLNAPPVDFHPMRQFHSLLIARAEYFETQPSIPAWRREVASLNRQAEALREPQLLEFVVAYAYRVAEGEHLWIPRLLSVAFWLLGGMVMYLLGERLFSPNAALFSMGTFLFLPFSIAISRSVQPESMMILMMLLGIYLALGSRDQWPSTPRLILAALASAMAMLVKPFLAFLIFGALFAYYYRIYGWRFARRLSWWLFVALSLVPVLAYYAYGWLVSPTIQAQIGVQFLPGLLITREFWGGWFGIIGEVAGYVPFVGGLLVFLLIRRSEVRALLLGLWLGYGLFGLVFTYPAYTHNYYSVALLPVVALSLGPLGAIITSQLAASYSSRLWRGAFVVGLAGVMGLISLVSVRPSEYTINFAEPVVTIAPRIGDLINHSTRTVFLADAYSYGLPLKYYGEISGSAWPESGDFNLLRQQGKPTMSAEQRMEQYEGSADYFIVTNFLEFQYQQDLQDFLFSHYPVFAQTSDYIIFDLRTELDG